MAISPQMQEKIGRIESLIQNGYTLKKTKYGFIDFRKSPEKGVNIYGGFKSSPAGFSWIAFFFPFAVCAQIKEWSYFYNVGCFWLIVAVIEGMTNIPLGSNPGGGIAISMLYGYMFPYLRKIAKDKGTVDGPIGQSVVIGILLSIVSSIPALIIDIIAGNI